MTYYEARRLKNNNNFGPPIFNPAMEYKKSVSRVRNKSRVKSKSNTNIYERQSHTRIKNIHAGGGAVAAAVPVYKNNDSAVNYGRGEIHNNKKVKSANLSYSSATVSLKRPLPSAAPVGRVSNGKIIPAREKSVSLKRERENVEFKFKTIRLEKGKGMPIFFITSAIAVTVVFCMLVLSHIGLYESSMRITELKNNIVKMQKEENNLKLEWDSRIDLGYIEDYAVNKLGMVKKDLLPHHYVSNKTGDVSEVITSENNFFSSVISSLFD